MHAEIKEYENKEEKRKEDAEEERFLEFEVDAKLKYEDGDEIIWITDITAEAIARAIAEQFGKTEIVAEYDLVWGDFYWGGMLLKDDTVIPVNYGSKEYYHLLGELGVFLAIAVNGRFVFYF